MPKLRHFMYLNDEMVSQFLAQVEGGEFDEQRITDQQSSSSGIGASVKAGPASAHADRGRAGTSQAETVLRQSAPSRFNRLHGILTTEHELGPLSVADQTIWDGLEVGEIIEVVVTIEIPEFLRSMDQMAGLSSLAPMIDAFTDIADLDLPGLDTSAAGLQQAKDLRKVLPKVDQLAEAVGKAALPVLLRLADAPRYQFLVLLQRDLLRVPARDLDGQVHALLKVDNHIKPGKPQRVPLIAGVPQQSREQRRAGGSSENSSTLVLKAPAARASCVAIYR